MRWYSSGFPARESFIVHVPESCDCTVAEERSELVGLKSHSFVVSEVGISQALSESVSHTKMLEQAIQEMAYAVLHLLQLHFLSACT